MSKLEPPPRHAAVLGLAQAAALWPGVSRTGATLAAARALGYDRAEASLLSFGVAGPGTDELANSWIVIAIVLGVVVVRLWSQLHELRKAIAQYT